MNKENTNNISILDLPLEIIEIITLKVDVEDLSNLLFSNTIFYKSLGKTNLVNLRKLLVKKKEISFENSIEIFYSFMGRDFYRVEISKKKNLMRTTAFDRDGSPIFTRLFKESRVPRKEIVYRKVLDEDLKRILFLGKNVNLKEIKGGEKFWWDDSLVNQEVPRWSQYQKKKFYNNGLIEKIIHYVNGYQSTGRYYLRCGSMYKETIIDSKNMRVNTTYFKEDGTPF